MAPFSPTQQQTGPNSQSGSEPRQEAGKQCSGHAVGQFHTSTCTSTHTYQHVSTSTITSRQQHTI
jgi:hypothetical protein